MNAYIALLRAINVMGTGKLPMADLKKLCEAAGFKSVRTYIASGNVVFKSSKTEAKVKAVLEAEAAAYTGRPVGVLIRTAAEMATVLAHNPFPQVPGNRTVACFLDDPPAANALHAAKNWTNEQIELGLREIYIYFPDGQGQSKLNIPAAKAGTIRNMNTISTLAKMAQEL